jgi:hypothetical protein
LAQVTVGEPFILEQEAAYLPARGEEYWGGLAEGPGEYFAVWLDQAGGLDFADGIYGQRILPDGGFAAPGSLEIFEDPDRQPHGVPAVAWNGSAYLVIWHEFAPFPEPVILYGARVDQFGNVFCRLATRRVERNASPGHIDHERAAVLHLRSLRASGRCLWEPCRRTISGVNNRG